MYGSWLTWRRFKVQIKPLFRAIVHGIVASYRIEGFRACLRKCIVALLTIFSLAFRKQKIVSNRTYLKRMAGCRACSIYDRKRKTCGNHLDTFLNPHTAKRELIGCLCHMPTKALFGASDCWARERGLDIGWANGVRGEHNDTA